MCEHISLLVAQSLLSPAPVCSHLLGDYPVDCGSPEGGKWVLSTEPFLFVLPAVSVLALPA